MTVAGHRWEYQTEYRGYKCVGLPIGGVESFQWCIGCGCLIDDIELRKLNLPRKEIYLDMLADNKGFRPIQAGTFAELKLKVGYRAEDTIPQIRA